MNSRRDFLKSGAAALIGSACLRSGELTAQSRSRSGHLHWPLGIQLYSVRELLPKDFAGTLKQLGALGYREVEGAGFYGHSADQVKHDLQEAGLRCVSAHYSYHELQTQFDQIVPFAKALGMQYLICPSPTKKPSNRKAASDGSEPKFTLDDWRWNAEQFNQIGKRLHAEGLKFGFHNHWRPFIKQDGIVPYDELMRLTDPAYVTMEMDCGWVVVGGADPIDLLRRYPTRITMLHVKNFKFNGTPVPGSKLVSTPTGQGSIDYRPIFEAAAKTGHVKHCFVEQEQYNMPIMQELKVNAEFMRSLHA